MSGLIVAESAGLGLLLMLSAFFSSAETALFSLSPMQIHRLRRHYPKATKRLEELLAAPGDLLVSILIGNTIVNVAAASLGFVLAEQLVPNHGAVIAIPAVTLFLIIFGEMAPKRLGMRKPDALAILYLPALAILIKACAPIHFLLDAITHTFQSHFTPRRSALTKAELLTAVDVGHEEGVINKEERAMMDGIIRLEKLQAKDVMTPRVDLISLDIEDEPAAFAPICRKARFRFLPVCEGDLDHVKGFLDVARYLMDPVKDISTVLHPHFYVPDTAPLDTLLTMFQQQSRQLAIVIDEYGGTAGLITIGDILDEIAEFTAEQPDGQSPNIEPVGENRWQVAGDTSLEEVNYELDLGLDIEGADRIAGWVTAHARRFPKTGDIISSQKCRVTVVQMRKHRITRVLIEKNQELSEFEQEEGIQV
jgi:CBS domain containing-hemolysin-like protein